MSTEEPHLLNLSAEFAETEFTEMISINIICRLCANQSDKLIGIYSEDGINNDLSGKMNLYLPIKVSESDNLPLQCCWQCASTLLAWHDLVVSSVEADRRFRSYQFVTEKQLVEISYGGTESLLANNTDDNLQHNRKICNENYRSEDKDEYNKNVSSDICISTKEVRQNEHTHLKENTSQNATEELTHSTDVSNDRENRELTLVVKSANDMRNKEVSESGKSYTNYETKICNICESNFTSKPLLQKHLKTIHNISTVTKTRRKKCDIVASFTCSVCNRSYTRKYDLEKHIKTKHPQEEILKNKYKNTEIINKCKIRTSRGEKAYQCDFCSKTFTKSYSLTRHRTIHSNFRLHCCHLCGKRFRLTSLLIRHVNEFHHNNRKFKCSECDKSFKNKYTRDEHMNTHNNVRPYICDICGKSFRQSASLYVHKRFHSEHFPYTCQICDKKFQSKQNFKDHSLIHTGYKPFQCQQCDMAFKSKRDLSRHKKCHMPGFCDLCGVTFGQIRYMKLHRKSCKQSLESLEPKRAD